MITMTIGCDKRYYKLDCRRENHSLSKRFSHTHTYLYREVYGPDNSGPIIKHRFAATILWIMRTFRIAKISNNKYNRNQFQYFRMLIL